MRRRSPSNRSNLPPELQRALQEKERQQAPSPSPPPDELDPFLSGNPALSPPPAIRSEARTAKQPAPQQQQSPTPSPHPSHPPLASSADSPSPSATGSPSQSSSSSPSTENSSPPGTTEELLQNLGEQVLLGADPQGHPEVWIELQQRFVEGLRFRLRWEDGQLTALFQPASQAVLVTLRQHLPQLRERLKALGLQQTQLVLEEPPPKKHP